MKIGLQVAGHGTMNGTQSLVSVKVYTTHTMLINIFIIFAVIKELPYVSVEITKEISVMLYK